MRSIKRIKHDLEWVQRKTRNLEGEIRRLEHALALRPCNTPQHETIRPLSSFVAPVVYRPPTFNELRRRFPAYVNPEYERARLDSTVTDWYPELDPPTESVVVGFELVHPNICASTESIMAMLHERHLEPACYEELLGFAQQFPDTVLTHHPIVALGSVARIWGGDGVACIWSDASGRHLDLCRIAGSDWDTDFRFLATPA